jgi:hypothetical protein
MTCPGIRTAAPCGNAKEISVAIEYTRLFWTAPPTNTLSGV